MSQHPPPVHSAAALFGTGSLMDFPVGNAGSVGTQLKPGPPPTNNDGANRSAGPTQSVAGGNPYRRTPGNKVDQSKLANAASLFGGPTAGASPFDSLGGASQAPAAANVSGADPFAQIGSGQPSGAPPAAAPSSYSLNGNAPYAANNGAGYGAVGYGLPQADYNSNPNAAYGYGNGHGYSDPYGSAGQNQQGYDQRQYQQQDPYGSSQQNGQQQQQQYQQQYQQQQPYGGYETQQQPQAGSYDYNQGANAYGYQYDNYGRYGQSNAYNQPLQSPENKAVSPGQQSGYGQYSQTQGGYDSQAYEYAAEHQQFETPTAAIVPSLVDESTTAVSTGGAVVPSVNPFQADDGAGNAYASFTNEDVSVSTDNLADGGYSNTTELTPAAASTSGVVPEISLHAPPSAPAVQKSGADFEDVDTVRTRAASAGTGLAPDPFKEFENSQVFNDLDDLILGSSTTTYTAADLTAPTQPPAQDHAGQQYAAEAPHPDPGYVSYGGDAVVPQQTYPDSSTYGQSAGPPTGYGTYQTPRTNYSKTPDFKPAVQPTQYGATTNYHGANINGEYSQTAEVKSAPAPQANNYGAPAGSVPPQQYKLQDWQDSRKASIASASSAPAFSAASPSVEFIFCGQCGKKNHPEFNFCGKCGFRLHGSSPAQAAATPSQARAVLQEQPPMQQQPSQPTIYGSYAHSEQPNQWGTQAAAGYASPMAAQQTWSGYEQQQPYEQQNSVNPFGQQTYDNTTSYGTVEANAYGQHEYGAPNSYFQHLQYGAPQQAPAAQSSPPYGGIHDPLGRMRGHAIATFSFGKLVVTKPSRQNRFVTGANGAQTVVEKAYPDKVSIIQVHTLLEKSFTDTVSLHPGPIISAKSKPKKKELAKIADEFVQRAEAASKDARQAYDVAASGTGFRTGGASSWVDVLRAQEQVLLMRVIRLAIENDGVLLGAGPKGDASTAALRDLLLADHDPNTYSAIGQIESLLLQGDRAGACRAAIGADLWAHALVIASHVDKETYTDVVMNFSQREFDPAIAGAVTQVKEFRPSLKLLYGLFGGMGRVAVAEYLPDDVDTVDESSPLQGWKEVLAIILSNRTPGDVAAISALGDRLRACNRLAAAHICYLLSTSHSLLSGVDAVGVRLILLDADHVAAPYFFFKDVKAVQLTELYEASQTLISGMGLANGLPHFQAYKMLYAMLLADVGYYEQAAKYCESIEVFVKTYSKGSPYFHRKFLEGLRDLSDRLSEATKSGSTDAKDGTSWFKTVSSAIDKGFNKIMNDAIGDPSGNPSADVGRKSPAKALTMVQDTFAALTGAASGSSLSLLRPQSTPASIASPVDGSTSGPMSGATHSSQMFIYGGTYASTEQNVSQTQSADVLSQDAGASYGGYSGYYGNGDSTAVGDYVMGFSQNQASAYAGNGYSSNQEGYAPAQNQYDQYGNAGYGTDGSYSQAGAEGYSSYQGYSNGYGESYDPNATAGNQATYDPNAGASYGQQPYDPSAQYGQTTDSHGSEYDQYGYGGQNPGSYATQESGYTQPAEYGFTYQPSQTEQTPDPYPYGQSAPVPDNAPKAAEQPARTQSVPPPSMSDTKHTDFEDDLGLGNNALKKKEDKNNSQGDGKEAAKPEKPAATSSYTSMFSSITKVIPFMGRRKSDPDMGGKEKEKATQVHLGGENPFVYNPTTKRWERKDGAPIREEEKKPPPPPMTPVQLSRGSTPAIPGTPSPALSTSSVTDGLPGRQPSPGPYTPGTKRGSVASRRTARSRYVDVMNPDSANRTPETSVKSFLPTPTLEGAEARVFKPLTPGVSTYSDMSDSVGETRPSGDAGEAAYGSAEPLRKAPAPGTPTPFAGAAPLRSSTSSAPPASFRPNRSPSARNAVPPPGAPPTPGTSQMSRSRIPPGLPSGANARPQPGPYVSPQGGPNPNVPSPIQPPGARYSSASPNTPPFVPNVAAGQANRHSFSGTRPSLAATPGGQGPPPSDL